MQLGFFKKQGEQKLSSICRFHPYGPLLWKKRVAERRAIMAASIFGSSFVPLPGVFRGWLLNKKMTCDARRGRMRGGGKGRGLRGEETNQMFKRDGSPSRLCVFSGKGRRGYSRAGDCSNNIPPIHSPPSFPSVRRSIFSPCHAILDSRCCGWINWERDALSKWAFFFFFSQLLHRVCAKFGL